MEHYSRPQVIELVERIRRAATPVEPGSRTTPLRDAVADANLGQMAWGVVLPAALDGRLKLLVRPDAPADRLVDSLLVDAARSLHDLRASARLLDPDEAAVFLSVNEAAAFLGVGRPTISRLRKFGLLPKDNGAAPQSLERADLYWFQRQYMMTAELARSLNVSAKVASKMAADAGIKPAWRLSDNRDLVWRRKEIERAFGLAHEEAADEHFEGPGVFFYDSEAQISVYVTKEAIRAADPTWKGSQWKEPSMLPVVDAQRAMFEMVARAKASRGLTCGPRKVRIEDRDVVQT